MCFYLKIDRSLSVTWLYMYTRIYAVFPSSYRALRSIPLCSTLYGFRGVTIVL